MPQQISSFFLSVLILLSILFLHPGCEEPEDIGKDLLPPQDNLGVNFTDTTTIHAFTQKEEPFKTGMRQRVLAGSYQDKVFGQTNASFYTQLRMPTTNLDFGSNPAVDSVVLSLAYDGFYGDTTQAMTFEVYELDDNLHSDTSYYSNDEAAVLTPPLGSKTINNISPTTPVIAGGDTMPAMLRIPVTNSLAQRFFNAGSSVFVNNESFLDYFKGIHVKVQENKNDGSILYFDPFSVHSALTIYYRSDNDTVSTHFHLGEHSAKFNRYEHDYTDPVAKPALRKQVIQEDTTPPIERLFLQSMAGVNVKIQFPHIEQWEKKNIALNKATLVVSPDPGDLTSDKYKKPERLGLVKINNNGEFELLTDFTVSPEIFDGNFNSNRNEYRFTITRHMQELLNGAPDNGLIMVNDKRALNAYRLMLMGPQAQNSALKLELIYTDLDNQ
ncbi:MAG: DUF4270 domain-containing protein [Bacteroidales bacterium]